MRKLVKIKIKRKGICIGTFLSGVYARMSKQIEESNSTQDEKAGAFQVMHLTDMHISHWCACPTCKKHIDKVLSIIKENDEQRLRTHNDMQDGSQSTADGGADSQS